MPKDFLYEASNEDDPFDYIAHDIYLHGQEFIDDMDHSHFLFQYGITKDEYFLSPRAHCPHLSCKKLESHGKHEPFDQKAMEEFMKTYREESIKLVTSPRIAPGGNKASLANNKFKAENKTSVRPSEVKKKQKQIKPQEQSNKPKPAAKKEQKAPYPAPQAKAIGNTQEQQAQKAFTSFKDKLLKSSRSPSVKKDINLRFKALKRTIVENGIKWGSPEWGKVAGKFFPEAVIRIIQPETVDNNPEAKADKIGTSETSQDAIQQDTTDPQATSETTPPQEDSLQTEEQNETPQDNLEEEAAPQQEKGNVNIDNTNQADSTTTRKNKEPKEDKLKQDSNADNSPAIEQEMVDLSQAETLAEGQDFVQGVQGKKPTSFLNLMKNSEAPLQSAQNAKVENISDKIPEIDTPTGLEPTEQEDKEREKAELPETSGFEPKAPVKDSGNSIADQILTPTEMPTKPVISQELSGSGDQESSAEQAKELIANLPTTDNSINTSPGTPPDLPLTGEADPQHADKVKDEAYGETQAKKAEADMAASVEVPTESILPKPDEEKLTTELSELEFPPVIGEELEMPAEVPADIQKSFDENAQSYLDEEASEEYAKNDQALADLEEQSEEERQNTLSEIDTETENTKQQQLEAQNQAKAETDQYKADWQKENQDVINDFETQAQQEYATTQSDINQKVSETNSETQSIYQDAETKAQQEQAKADKEAQEEQDKVNKQDKGFWDSLTDAVSGFFDSVKKALNNIFDALRAAVKRIIDEAKKLASAVIDMARDFIVSAIKIFGELLKGLVNIVFAAFPKLAKKFNNLIDKAVNKATEIVNQLAEGLKAAVNALLDLLGAVLDAILAVYQAVLNAILEVLEFIAVGIIKILKGLANVAISIGYAVKELKGALVKEFIGEDITSPLPSVEASETELPDLEKMKADVLASESMGNEMSPEIENQLNSQLDDKSVLNDDDFVFDGGGASALDSELVSNVMSQINEGEPFELGGASNPITTPELQENAPASMGQADIEGEGQAISEGDGGGSSNLDADTLKWLKMSDGQKLNWHIDQMGASSGEPDPQSGKAETPAENESTNPAEIARKTGRLGIGKRLEFVGRQMIKGMQMWWNKNKLKVYLGLIAILVVGGVVAFFTGGAGLIALLELGMQALTAFFIADAILRIKGHLWDWLKNSWDGNPEAGGKSLATALAVIFSEFLFDYVLKGIGNVLKKVKKMIKSTKAFKKVSRAARKVNVGAKRTVRKLTRPMRGVTKKGGKFVMKMKKGWQKGIKKLGDLREKILAKFGFKRIWFEKHGHWLQLWGEFNSTILISKTDAEGNQKFDTRDLTSADRKLLGNMDDGLNNTRKEVGRTLSADELIVSDSFAETFKKMDPKEQAELFNELKKLDPEDVRTRMGGSNPPAWLDDPNIPDKVKEVYYKRSDLNKKMNPVHGQNSHHVNPIESLGNNKVLQDAVENGFDFNNIDNGINLERYSSKLDTPGASPNGTHANHPNYTGSVDEVHKRFKDLYIDPGNYKPSTDAKLYTEVFTEKLKLNLEKHCAPEIDINKRIKVDDLFKNVDIDEFYDEIITEFFNRKNNL